MMLIRQSLPRVAVGLAAGGVLAVMLARSMAAMLFGIDATDPVSFAAVSLILLGVSAGATIVPALQITRTTAVPS